MRTRRATLKGIAAGGLVAAVGRVRAQEDRSTITVLVGAASSMDYTARIISDQLRESLGRSAVTMSRLGAGQRLALGEVRRAVPDGRTLVFSTSAPFALYPHIYTKLEYDPDKDFTPIIAVSQFDVAIATGPATSTGDLRTLIDWARTQKNETVYGAAPGNGSFPHFIGIAMSLTTGLGLVPVPYKDSGVGIVDLASGRIPIMITGLSPLVPMHKAGKIRILAVSGSARSPLVPEVPTLREAGVDIARSTTAGVFGPAGMTQDLVDRLHDAIRPMLANPAIVERLKEQAMISWPGTGAQFAQLIRDDRAYFGMLAKQSGYVPEPA